MKRPTEQWIKENLSTVSKSKAQQTLAKYFPGYYIDSTKNMKAFIYDDQCHIVATMQFHRTAS